MKNPSGLDSDDEDTIDVLPRGSQNACNIDADGNNNMDSPYVAIDQPNDVLFEKVRIVYKMIADAIGSGTRVVPTMEEESRLTKHKSRKGKQNKIPDDIIDAISRTITERESSNYQRQTQAIAYCEKFKQATKAVTAMLNTWILANSADGKG